MELELDLGVGPAYTGRQQVRVETLPTSNKEFGGGAEQIWRANEDQRERQLGKQQ